MANRSWFHTHLSRSRIAGMVWLLVGTIVLVVGCWQISLFTGWITPATIQAPALFSQHTLGLMLLQWMSIVMMFGLYTSISSVRRVAYGNPLRRFLYRNVRPVVIIGHGLSATLNTLLISRLTGNVWVSLMGTKCWNNESGDGCWKYNAVGLTAICHSFVFGGFYALHFLHAEKELQQFDAVHQPIIFRIRSSVPAIVGSGPSMVFKYARVMIPTYLVLSRVFDFEQGIAHLFGGDNSGTPATTPSFAVVVLFLLLSATISTFIWEAARRILEITMTQLPPISLTNVELVDALGATELPLLRHLGYLQLDRRLRYPDTCDESLFSKLNGQPASAWTDVVKHCTTELKRIQITAAPVLKFQVPDLRPDYSNRPAFDDPNLVGQPIRPAPGWSSVASAPSTSSDAISNAHFSGKFNTSLGGRVRRYAGKWALYLQHKNSWFCPNMAFVEASARLQHQRDGTFVVHRYHAQSGEKRLFQQALTLTVVRDTHPDREGGAVARSGSTWSGSVVHEQGKGYHLFGAPSDTVHYFSSIHELVHYFSQEPYQIDFAGKRYLLLNTTKAGPIYTAPLEFATRGLMKMIVKFKKLYFVGLMLNKTPDDRGRELWCDFSCVIWGTRSLCYAFCTMEHYDVMDSRAVVIKESLDTVVKELLRTHVALDTYRGTNYPAKGCDTNFFAFPTSKANGRRVAVETSVEQSEDFGCRYEITSTLCRIFTALPDEVARMLRQFEPKDVVILRKFLARESVRQHIVSK